MHLIQDSEIQSIGDDSSAERDTLSVLWAITKGCNFRCSYCVYNEDLRTTVFSSKAQLLRAARTLERLARPSYQITLYGGEPTQHPHFLDLLTHFAASCAPISLRMFTNGSQTSEFFENMINIVKTYYFGIIFSFHPEFAKFEKFLRNVEIWSTAGMSAAVSYMFVPTRREEARRQLCQLLTLREKTPFFATITTPYKPDGTMGEGCTAADLAWIEATRTAFETFPAPPHLRTPLYTRIQSRITISRNGEPETLPPETSLQFLSRPKTPSYTNYHCCGGTNVLFVEADGAIRGGVCNASPAMGNLFRVSEAELVQSMRPVRCTASACASIENIPLPKFKDPTEAEICTESFRQRAKRYLYQSESTRLAGEESK